MKTFMARKEDVEKKWYLIDAEGQVLGRLASTIAKILRGKHKSIFTPHVDTGDYVVVINAEKVRLTGKKLDGKVYYYHSGYPGGLKMIKARKMIAEKPEKMIEEAVWGMIPKGRLGRRIIKKLKVYRGPVHPHRAQNPEPLDISKFL